MKRIHLISLMMLVSSLFLVGCDALLGVDSDRVVFEDQHDMGAANDSLYAMFGLFSTMQELADSYVLLGELRADLMDVTESSNPHLLEINQLSISPENPYANKLPVYYSLINNCNYICYKVDTTVVLYNQKVNKRIMAAAKAIRAWAYLQLVLNYGEAVYFDSPLLSLQDAEKNHPVYTLEEMAPHLIADLLPFRNEGRLGLGSVYSINMDNAQFPIEFLLGDLYLWTGNYQEAANAYHNLIYKERYLVSNNFRSAMEVLNGAFTGKFLVQDWNDIFAAGGSTELITQIGATNEYADKFFLDSLCLRYEIKGSDVVYNLWNAQHYTATSTLDSLADLRMHGTLYADFDGETYLPAMTPTDKRYLYKHVAMNDFGSSTSTSRSVMVYRVGLLYLRYAEAVNRLGQPNLAMAVLKYGVNAVTLANRSYIPAHEVPSPLPDYMDFPTTYFSGNIGLHARGCGNVNLDTTFFVLPARPTLADSIVAMEDLLIDELALETACEGNRFHDLMRMAIRRDDNHVLADRVSAKHSTHAATINAKLLDRKNWYLPR